MSASASCYSCDSFDGIWSEVEKTLDMPYYGCSKLLKVFYWETHTRFTVSVGINLSLTKTRRTRSADCIWMDKRARISPLWEVVYYSGTCIVYLAVRETEYFTDGISHACANSGAQAVFSLPRKKRPGNEASSIVR